MLTLITNLIIAARYYFQIHAITADYDLTKRIQSDILETQSAIDALRARGDPSALATANRLYEQLLSTQGIAAGVSAARPAALGRPGGADEGRPVPPAGG